MRSLVVVVALLLSCDAFVSVSRCGERKSVAVYGVTKKNRRRVSEKNTGGSVGITATRKKSVDLPHRIFVTNVNYEAVESDLVSVFAAIGPVVSCKLIRDSFTGNSKGWGFVTFADPIHATAALQTLQGFKVKGRPIKLDEATSLARKRKEAKVAAGYAKREAKRQAKAAAAEESLKKDKGN